MPDQPTDPLLGGPAPQTPDPDPTAPVESTVALPADPAAQSLSDALRVAFILLKGVMAVLVVLYLASGYFTVDQQHKAVKLRFGQIVGEPGSRVLEPGPHIGLPAPFESRILVPTAPQIFELRQSFWFEVDDPNQSLDDLAAAGRTGPLNPVNDGYLITGDANIVHGIFRVTYRVTDVERYVENILDQQRAQQVVESVAERALVHAAANVQADDFIAGRSQLAGATDLAKKYLSEIQSGLTIDRIEVLRPAMPIAVRDAYNEVNNAESDRARAIDEAQRDRARTLQAAGGPAAAPSGPRDGPLTRLIDEFEALPRTEPRRAELEQQLANAFRSLTLETDRGPFNIGGEAALIIEQAESFRTRTAEGVTREAQRFRQLNDAYQKNPDLFKQRYWQAARAEIFGEDNDYEVFYIVDNGRVYLEINRDPEIEQERERRRAEGIGEEEN